MVSYKDAAKYVRWTLLGIVVAVGLLYGGDYVLVRVRSAYGIAGGPFGTATVYYASTLKNGKVELYYQNPMSVACVNSLFPHLGYTPCWYLRRTPVKDVD